MNRHIITLDNFYSHAQELRDFFEAQFSDPREAHEMRFVWDNWYIKDQYCLTRTPPYHYFPEDMYQKFHEYLVQWGRENLGCYDISPPWLSYYKDGDFQNWHADVPHGPWAFVFSLSPKDRTFEGGRTQLLKPSILNYWENFDASKGLERDEICEYIDPNFNRLTLFDPRFPHRVEPVRGSNDPLEARLVLHGWFTEPRPFVTDFEDEEQLIDSLNTQLEPLIENLAKFDTIQGLCSYKLYFSQNGNLERSERTSFTFTGHLDQCEEAEDLVSDFLEKIVLPANSKPYVLTLPLIFS
ncbi:MAG: 2OG-Fe(II) oxygenase [Bdellovibrionales bacterium]